MNVHTYSAGFVNRADGAMAHSDRDLRSAAAGAGVGMVIAFVALSALILLT